MAYLNAQQKKIVTFIMTTYMRMNAKVGSNNTTALLKQAAQNPFRFGQIVHEEKKYIILWYSVKYAIFFTNDHMKESNIKGMQYYSNKYNTHIHITQVRRMHEMIY